MHIRELQTLLDENSHLVQEFIQVQCGSDIIADLCHHRQMLDPHLQFTIQTRSINSSGDRIRQCTQDKEIVRVKGIHLVRLYIQQTQDVVFDLEGQGSLRPCFRQGIDIPVTRIRDDVIGDSLLTGLGRNPDQPLPQSGIDRFRFASRRTSTRTELQAVTSRLDGKYGNIVIMECTLDKFCDPPGQLVQVKNIGDLCTDPANEGQLLNTPFLYHLAMGNNQCK